MVRLLLPFQRLLLRLYPGIAQVRSVRRDQVAPGEASVADVLLVFEDVLVLRWPRYRLLGLTGVVSLLVSRRNGSILLVVDVDLVVRDANVRLHLGQVVQLGRLVGLELLELAHVDAVHHHLLTTTG